MLEANVVEPGGETVGFLAFERPQAADPVVLRLIFAGDRNHEVAAMVVL